MFDEVFSKSVYVSPASGNISQQHTFIDEIFTTIVKEIEQNINNISLENMKAPFFPITFSFWREQQYKKFQTELKCCNFATAQKWKYQFNDQINNKLQQKFCQKIKDPYFKLIFFENFNLPIKLSEAEQKNINSYSQFLNLAVNITNWCIQIEIANDLIEIAELFEMFEPTNKRFFIIRLIQSRENLIKELQLGVNSQKKFSLNGYTKFILLKSLSFSSKKLSEIIWSKGLTGISLSWGAILAILYLVVGGSAFPWAFVIQKMRLP